MRARRRKEAPGSRPGRLPDTIARLVAFIIIITTTTTTASGKRKTTRMRVLTFFHLKKTVRGPRRPLRGQSPGVYRAPARV